MESNNKKFNQKYNQIIIDLIKHKLEPLRGTRKHKILHRVNSKSNHLKQTNIPAVSSVPSTRLINKVTLHQEDKQNTECLLQKVKQYLLHKRREKHHHLEDTNSLQSYIQLFQRPFHNLKRVKRQSIQYNFFETQANVRVNEDKSTLVIFQKQLCLEEEESSILNAKIRRKLNHRKIVDLHRKI